MKKGNNENSLPHHRKCHWCVTRLKGFEKERRWKGRDRGDVSKYKYDTAISRWYFSVSIITANS